MTKKISLFWFRRDIRLDDNHGLYRALKENENVLPIFIFDSNILSNLSDRYDRRVQFIHQELSRLKQKIEKMGGSLHVEAGSPLTVYKSLISKYDIKTVYTNHDYEPYAKERDKEIAGFLRKNGIGFKSYKDQVIFEKSEVVKPNGKPYTVYTPYMKKWREKISETGVETYDAKPLLNKLYRTQPISMPSLEKLGFAESNTDFPPKTLDKTILSNYHNTRDFPAQKGTTRLSLHLRFGTISIRHLVKIALKANDSYLNELIWREFYMMVLWQFPHVVSGAFKPEYDRIEWKNDKGEFKAWQEGKTGIPIVDAGMRELNETGYMHNRVRMIVASFLTKNLLIDWRWGESYFAEKLLDFDLASNNGGWQWAAGTGCDAAPYFRVFNPVLQAQKFDPQGKYIKKWVPELGTLDYPQPIVDLKASRKRALDVYKQALNDESVYF